jgi:hypothetical protein
LKGQGVREWALDAGFVANSDRIPTDVDDQHVIGSEAIDQVRELVHEADCV